MTDDMALDAILQLVRARTGFDFTHYRKPTVARRVRNRMARVGARTLDAYLDMLLASPAEAGSLLAALTIKVSRFYRNAAAFDLVRDTVLPTLASQARGRSLRLWSAGCGRGEEPYTLAMLLEALAIPGTVVATDIDESALQHAAQAEYGEEALHELPRALRERFLEPGARAGDWRVREEVRRRVSFRRQDLAARATKHAVRFDLVCCRNVLIYLERPAQQAMLARLAAALAQGGFLLLGEAEWPSGDAMRGLEVIANRARLFRALAEEMVPA